MIADAQARAILEDIIATARQRLDSTDMPFERKTDVDGYAGLRVMETYAAPDGGRVYAGAVAFVSESRERLVALLEAVGGPLRD